MTGGTGSIPGKGTNILYATQCGQKNKRKKKGHTMSETAAKLMLASYQKLGAQRTVEHKPKHDEKK